MRKTKFSLLVAVVLAQVAAVAVAATEMCNNHSE